MIKYKMLNKTKLQVADEKLGMGLGQSYTFMQ